MASIVEGKHLHSRFPKCCVLAQTFSGVVSGQQVLFDFKTMMYLLNEYRVKQKIPVVTAVTFVIKQEIIVNADATITPPAWRAGMLERRILDTISQVDFPNASDIIVEMDGTANLASCFNFAMWNLIGGNPEECRFAENNIPAIRGIQPKHSANPDTWAPQNAQGDRGGDPATGWWGADVRLQAVAARDADVTTPEPGDSTGDYCVIPLTMASYANLQEGMLLGSLCQSNQSAKLGYTPVNNTGLYSTGTTFGTFTVEVWLTVVEYRNLKNDNNLDTPFIGTPYFCGFESFQQAVEYLTGAREYRFRGIVPEFKGRTTAGVQTPLTLLDGAQTLQLRYAPVNFPGWFNTGTKVESYEQYAGNDSFRVFPPASKDLRTYQYDMLWNSQVRSDRGRAALKAGSELGSVEIGGTSPTYSAAPAGTALTAAGIVAWNAVGRENLAVGTATAGLYSSHPIYPWVMSLGNLETAPTTGINAGDIKCPSQTNYSFASGPPNGENQQVFFIRARTELKEAIANAARCDQDCSPSGSKVTSDIGAVPNPDSANAPAATPFVGASVNPALVK